MHIVHLVHLWSGASGKKNIYYDNLHVFGCPIFYHVTHSKLERRKKIKNEKQKLQCLETRKIVNSRDVTFNKSRISSKMIKNNDGTSKPMEKVVFSPKVVVPY